MLASIDVREGRNQHRAGMRRHVQTIGDKCGPGGGLRGGARRYAETGIERAPRVTSAAEEEYFRSLGL
jgi:hypothetical protein